MPDHTADARPLSGPRPDDSEFTWTFWVPEEVPVWAWTDGAPDPTAMQPVRRPRSGASSRHIPVRAFSTTTGDHLNLESGLEHDLLRVLDRDPAVAWLVGQPCTITWQPPGSKSVRHTPDVLSTTKDGQVTVWDVKSSSAAAGTRFPPVKAATQRAAEEVGWDYQVFTGLPPVHRHNLLWLQGYRARPSWSEHHEDSVLRRASAECTLGDLLREVSPERRTVVWHLIWSGQFRVDLTARLTPATKVAP